MYLGDVEVFRTSTAEPTVNGIAWTYIKEMDQYNALWETDQKIIFDLGNLIDNTYTAAFNTTLTATFFTIPNSSTPADTILPISARRSSANMPSAFQVPTQNASVSYRLPRNVKRAVVSLSACGQSAEEFWYTNVPSSDTNTFTDTTGTLYGYSPFREVQLLIDGQLAGVSWPFPIIFTGGIVPGFWRPIVGIDAFDLREHEIDVTPWLPLLCDGASHTFEIRVAGLNDDGMGHASLSQTIGSYWVVTGKIFLFLDQTGSITTGSQPTIDTLAPQIAITSSVSRNSTGANETLTYTTHASRALTVTSTIITSTGPQPVTWTQHLSYSNYNALTAQGLVQLTSQNTTGTDTSTSGYASTYTYPLTINSSYTITNPTTSAFSISATLSRDLDLAVFGPSVFPSGIQSFNTTTTNNTNSTTPKTLVFHPALSHNPYKPPQLIPLPPTLPQFSGSHLHTTQAGSATYLAPSPGGTSSISFGTTAQDFIFSGVGSGDPGVTVELYRRHVLAVNGSLTEDTETLFGRTLTHTLEPGVDVESGVGMRGEEGGFSVRELLGRGPGESKRGVV